MVVVPIRFAVMVTFAPDTLTVALLESEEVAL